MNSPPPKPEGILTNFFAEPTVLLVPITSRDNKKKKRQRHITLVIKVLDCDRQNNMVGLNQLMES